MLAIEIDGTSHNGDDAFLKDAVRQAKLESLGIKFIRFTEAEVKYNMANVLRAIEGDIIKIVKENPAVKLPAIFDMSLLDS